MDVGIVFIVSDIAVTYARVQLTFQRTKVLING